MSSRSRKVRARNCQNSLSLGMLALASWLREQVYNNLDKLVAPPNKREKPDIQSKRKRERRYPLITLNNL